LAIYASDAAIMPAKSTVICTGAADGRDRYAHPFDITKAEQIA